MKLKSILLVGVVWVIILALSVNGILQFLNDPTSDKSALALANGLLTIAYIAAFGIVGGLILGYQPRNVIGALLVVMSFSLVSTLLPSEAAAQTMLESNPQTPIWAFLINWFNQWSWWLLIGPLLLLLLLFPTGRLVSPRWRWVVGLLLTTFLLFVIGASASPVWTLLDGNAEAANPISVIPGSVVDVLITLVQVLLVILAGLSVLSLIIRYRRAGPVEREQLKWFLSACAVFVVVFIIGFTQTQDETNFWNLLFDFSLMLIPVSIGIAILRYRLFDIDIIIRRTLTYALVTAALVIVFFGSVVLLQQVLAQFTGSGQNELVTVISTLVIAALFVPLRNRIQNVIDRRFNRTKYNAQLIMQQFGETVRDETDLEKLSGNLMNVVSETMQPKSVSVWLKKETGRQGNSRVLYESSERN